MTILDLSAITPEVMAAIEELRGAFPDATVETLADSHGGAYVTVNPVDIGPNYVPTTTWVKFHITFQYPMSDVYPHFIRPEIRRSDGQQPNNLPLGTGSSTGTFMVHGESVQAIQLSRRSNHLDPTVDTAALKLTKVLMWLRVHPCQ